MGIYFNILVSVLRGSLDLCVIIDSSGSIRDYNPSDGSYDNWQLQLEFISMLISALYDEIHELQVGAIVFSEQVNLEFSLDTFTTLSAIQTAIKTIPYLGQITNTPEALIQTRISCFGGSGNRPDVDDLAIMVTDGVPFPPTRWNPAIDEVEALRATGVEMIIIGVINDINPEFVGFVKAMSSPPQKKNENYFQVVSFTGLLPIVGSVASEILSGKYT